jgi:hypothetical protein
MMTLAPKVRSLLTPTQRRKLPASLSSYMDTRYLEAIRSGSGLYITGAGLATSAPASGSMGGEIMMMAAPPGAVIVR